MMRWKKCALALLACVAGLAAVGFTNAAGNPFAGSWSGTYALPDFGGGGTAELDISKSGVLMGRSVNFDGTGHTLIGHVAADGAAVGVAIFDDPGHAAETFSGNCSIDAGGTMVADLTGCIQNNCFALIVTVTQP